MRETHQQHYLSLVQLKYLNHFLCQTIQKSFVVLVLDFDAESDLENAVYSVAQLTLQLKLPNQLYLELHLD
jgi:hypothetical protein